MSRGNRGHIDRLTTAYSTCAWINSTALSQFIMKERYQTNAQSLSLVNSLPLSFRSVIIDCHSNSITYQGGCCFESPCLQNESSDGHFYLVTVKLIIIKGEAIFYCALIHCFNFIAGH